MDEGTLSAAIEAYSAQLQQVESVLSSGLDPSHEPDLLKLKDDLRQLIELTEASLVSVKKSQLLALLEDPSNSVASEQPAGGAVGNESSDVGERSGSSKAGRSSTRSEEAENEEEEGSDDEEVIDISGTKVCAPYRTSWGTLEFHNAMVVGAERSEDGESQVRVLYVHPTQKSMKPCPYFLEDKCRFMDNCSFSHGQVVSVSELREFQEADLSKLQEGSSCLARHEDGIWYPAKIKGIDGGVYAVKFDSLLLKETAVEADGVRPPLREDDLSSSSSSDDSGAEDLAYARVLDSAQSEDYVQACPLDFGGWEAHTRGIGSKLMLKMGYEYGKGLGKTSDGRVEPVQAVVLPKGKSLDQCSELTQRKTRRPTRAKDSQSGPKRRARKTRVDTLGQRGDIFDFLNGKLGDEPSRSLPPAPQKGGVDAYRGGKSAKRCLNVRSLQASERVNQTEKEVQRLTAALSRHAGSGTAMVNHLEEKLSAAQKLLVQQKAQELSIQRDQKKADTHKKMTEF